MGRLNNNVTKVASYVRTTYPIVKYWYEKYRNEGTISDDDRSGRPMVTTGS